MCATIRLFPRGTERLVVTMTRELINRLPETIRTHIECLRIEYNTDGFDHDAVRKELYGYTLGLRDAGFLTERERQILFVYGTVAPTTKKD